MSSEKFKSLIVDPNILDEGIDVSDLRTQTETNPLLLGNLEPGLKYDPTLQSTYSDLLQYYSGGLPLLPEPGKVVPPATGTPGTGDGGGGGGAGTIPTTPGGGNTAEDQRLIDAGIGLQVGPGQPVFAPGEAPVTQADIDNFNIAPGANVIPTDPRTMLPQMGTPQEFEFPRGGGADLATLPASPQPIDPLGMLPQDSIVTQQDVDEPKTFLQKIGLGDLDVKKAAVMTALNAAVGKPVSLLIDALGATLPERDPRQVTLEQLYDVKDGTIQSGLMKGYNPVSGNPFNPTFGLQDAYQERIDTIEESLNKLSKYDVTSPDYDPVKTKQQTDKLAKLKADKKTEADALGITASEDKRLAEAEMRQTIADAEAGIDQETVDLGTMDTTARPNPFADIDTGVGEFDITPTAPRDTVLGKEGIDRIDDYLDDQAFEEQFGTAPITGGPPSITEDQLRSQLDQSGEQIGTLEDLEEMEDLYATGPNIMRDFEFDQVDDTPPAPTPTPTVPDFISGGGRDRDDSPAPSGPPSTGFTAPTNQGQSPRGSSPAAVSTAGQAGPPSQRGGGGDGGGGGGGGGRWCCSQMVHHGLWNQSYQFSRLTVWSSKQPNWWRSGYNVWGKVIAKYLLNKKGFWTEVMQSFYDNHVRKQKRTLKSTIADIVIYPGSFICGLIWKKIPTKARLAKKEELK